MEKSAEKPDERGIGPHSRAVTVKVIYSRVSVGVDAAARVFVIIAVVGSLVRTGTLPVPVEAAKLETQGRVPQHLVLGQIFRQFLVAFTMISSTSS